MHAIPAFNSGSVRDFRAAYASFSSFLPKKSWLHIDYARAPFAAQPSTADWKLVGEASAAYSFEAHIMFAPRAGEYERLLALPCKRFFFHCDAVRDWDAVRSLARLRKKEIGCVIRSAADIPLVPRWVSHVLVLAVTPGLSGQRMGASALRVVRLLKTELPNVTITFDGGIDGRTAARVKAAGADRIVSSSYILGSSDPASAYARLQEI